MRKNSVSSELPFLPVNSDDTIPCLSCHARITAATSWVIVVKLRSTGKLRSLKPLCEACYKQYPSETTEGQRV